jgi:hypothetical protein
MPRGDGSSTNWTVQPADWETLRRNWEYGHAASAALTFLAFMATCLAAVRR